jgi:hypothetical protein
MELTLLEDDFETLIYGLFEASKLYSSKIGFGASGPLTKLYILSFSYN